MESPYYIEDNPTGGAKTAFEYPFAISFQLVTDLEKEMKKESAYCFERNFPDGVIEKYAKSTDGCFENTSRASFTLESGDHGQNKKIYFMGITVKTALRIDVYTFLSTNKETGDHQAINLAQQKALVDLILSTMIMGTIETVR